MGVDSTTRRGWLRPLGLQQQQQQQQAQCRCARTDGQDAGQGNESVPQGHMLLV
jgi:hypothetical protein